MNNIHRGSGEDAGRSGAHIAALPSIRRRHRLLTMQPVRDSIVRMTMCVDGQAAQTHRMEANLYRIVNVLSVRPQVMTTREEHAESSSVVV